MPTAVASAVVPNLPAVHQQHDINHQPSFPALAPNHAPSASVERRSPSGNSANGQNISHDRISPQSQPPRPEAVQSTPSQLPGQSQSQQPPPPQQQQQPVQQSQQQGQQGQKLSPDGKRNSPQMSRLGSGAPKIIVKKEPPPSPEVPATARHRPRKLDLTSSTASSMASASGGRPSGSMTAREPGALGMHGVGLACLSPGFQTQDPGMREQLQKSISVRHQQQSIIESRLQKTAKATDSAGERPEGFGSGLKTPSGKKRPPPAGLSIVPPSAQEFANERVIQSAPLHQTFTGRHQPLHTRYTAHGLGAAHAPGQSSHIHHVPHPPMANRLPPIADVIAGEGIGISNGTGRESGSAPGSGGHSAGRPGLYHSNSASNSSHSNHRPAFPSPGLPPPSHHHGPPSREQPTSGPRDYHPQHPHQVAHQAPHSARLPQREYRSAEEAVADMTSGREELLPKIVHYGGHQPPTPPSPPSGGRHHAQGPAVAVRGTEHGPHTSQHPHGGLTPNKQTLAAGSITSSGGIDRSASGARRRGRLEYERDNGSPPLGSGPSPRPRHGPFGEGRDSPEATRRKKEEFLGLCARAWDLFHS